mmetsp:Transcript_11985/g.17349  ORF Transcript_11985/g.17349 Transcript_11985/m.17349 type:complete len:148 (-) Transcript_11985:378-821(-)|eukprot:CAMPEP_0195511272 /NCGR_PEP_ID=MMETSP0794_2-20130614/3652_1 /TAXON_ID=515487 /ORGANISM="Stephanopyxis turris, Strain CCMP 815" /LENGTH=147 /DNA_ID=CAMNT_0040638837 /DNA_START=110 /DNA_END=553 /DNA_ORIENTATION=-
MHAALNFAGTGWLRAHANQQVREAIDGVMNMKMSNNIALRLLSTAYIITFVLSDGIFDEAPSSSPTVPSEEQADNEDDIKPWQWAINILFWAGAFLLVMVLCSLSSWLWEGCQGDGRVHAGGIATLIIFFVAFISVWLWLGITQVNW